MSHFEGSEDVARIDTKVAAKIASAVEDYDALVHDAAAATEQQRNMGIIESFKTYPKAVMWSVLLSTAIIMEGYDTMLLGNFFAMPAFTKRYGVCNGAGECQIPAPWMSGLNNGALVGEILGLQLTGVFSEKYGYKRTMLVALVFMTGFIFIPFFAQNLVTLLIGQILQGIPWGCFQTLTTAYAAEICPVTLRPYLTTYVNLCWVIGQLIASGILRATVERDDHWAYKIPYAIQFVWPVPILIGCLFAPESPWWLVRQGKHDEAEQSLRRLASSKGEFTHQEAQQTIAMMVHTNELEKLESEGSKYWDCFKKTDLRRTEIACMVWMIQVFCGSPLMGSSSYFYQQAGLPTTQAFNFSIGQFALGFCGTVASWWLMGWFGRRTLYLWGQYIMFALLVITGAVGTASKSSASSWVVGSMLLIFTFVYDISVGPVCYCLVAEISSTRLRAKTIVLARNFYNIGGIVVNIIQPRLLNPDAWGLGATSAFVWAGTSLLCITWTYFRLPEPKGRTYGELDILFEQKVNARKFRQTKVDQFGDLTKMRQEGLLNNEKASTIEKEGSEKDQALTSTVTPPVSDLGYNSKA
ncbi:putative maltose permease [Violaceomyces palustris]|uniref:Maltose permease n=1 Tax=Violaceomyces palustris TaxID=1673888 RepID=A0ACD0P0Y2_9BASI|nr:putative maltose permease [Violaceomyces palustris]